MDGAVDDDAAAGVADESVPDGVAQPMPPCGDESVPMPAGPTGVGALASQPPLCVVEEVVLDGALVGDAAALDRVPVGDGGFDVALAGDGVLGTVPAGGVAVVVGAGLGAMVEPFKAMAELPLLW